MTKSDMQIYLDAYVKRHGKRLEPHLQALLTVDGFIKAFWEIRPNYRTKEEAYEIVEQIYEATFGSRKYSSFKSFYNIYIKYLNERKKENSGTRC